MNKANITGEIMDKNILKQWETNKIKLEEYFSSTTQDKYNSYEKIVRKLFEICITKAGDLDDKWDLEQLTIIDHGEYQGTQIFIVPVNTYQPYITDYIMTHNHYGSCSGCDTLQGIHEYDEGIPNDKQVKGYMTLCLHLVQNMRLLSE